MSRLKLLRQSQFVRFLILLALITLFFLAILLLAGPSTGNIGPAIIKQL